VSGSRSYRSLILFLASVVVFSLGAASIASATCEEAAEKVDLEPKAPTFKAGEELEIEAENTGTVEWERKGEGFEVHTGSWVFKLGEGCEPKAVKSKAKCTRKLKCEKAGTITWTLKVESKKGVPAEKTLAIKCD
jgi:hypothetical protein